MKISPFSISLSLLCFTLIGCRQRLFVAGSGSMENTIKAGQKILVTATDSFERNDIAVFDYFGPDYLKGADETGQYPMHWEKRIYRIIAQSGDILNIQEGEVFINDRHIPLPEFARAQYQITSIVRLDDIIEHDPEVSLQKNTGDTLIYSASLSQDEVNDYRQRKPAIVNIKRMLMTTKDTFYATPSEKHMWSSDNYGPLRIPQPGETIIVNTGNYKLFKNIPGIEQGNFTIKEKLYFVMGDNRNGAEDSRYIGFISQSKMYGIIKIK